MNRIASVPFLCITLFALSVPAAKSQAAAPGAFAAHGLSAAAPSASAPVSLSTKSPRTENWNTISLAKSGLPLADIGGVLLSKIEQPECTRELLRLQWRAGDPIDLYVIRPHGVDKPPIALYLFNYTADIDLFRRPEWCRQVAREGVAIAGFVSAVSGQRFHAPRPMKQWFVSELQEALSTSTHDVQMILNYLESRGDLDTKHVGMFGYGSGGSVAILAAAADPRIAVLDLLDPWGDWHDWLKDSPQIPESERTRYLTPEFLQNVSDLDPVTYLPQLKDRTIRIEQAVEDPVTPPVARDKMAAAAPLPGSVVRYPDRLAQLKAWSNDGAARWLGEQLKPQPAIPPGD